MPRLAAAAEDLPDFTSAPPPPQQLTEEFRQQELARGAQSLYYFVVGICGLAAEDEEGNPTVGAVHRDLCAFLEGRPPHHPWDYAVVCMARGTAKSFWVRMYAFWRCLYIENFSVLLISNSAKNAEKIHFKKLYDLITTSKRAEYIRFIFQHRFPPGLEGTNSEQIALIKTDSQADVAFSYAGMESSLEGKHPDLICADDLEGADAKKSLVPNQAAYETWERVLWLPRFQARSQIVVVGTPWGRKPLVWRLRREARWKQESDNSWTHIKIFWRPIRDENGKCIWPERIPEWKVDLLLKTPSARTQFLLEEGDESDSLFDMAAITEAAFVWANPEKTLIRYRAFKFDPDKLSEDGYVVPEPMETLVPFTKLRFFIHLDPLHRMKAHRRSSFTTERPTRAAIIVVGVAPDGHVFVMDTWVGDADLHQQASELLRMYRLWPAAKITWEAVGAQHWLASHVTSQESKDPNWSKPISNGRVSSGVPLPRMSHRLHEGEKTTESKEWIFREILSPWLNHGVLHIRPDDVKGELWKQLENVMNEDVACDLVDALAQGPPHWRPDASDIAGRDFEARRGFVEAFVRGVVARRTGWSNPKWRGKS